MANIIVATFTNLPNGALDSFRQGFIDSLVKEGNNVLIFKTNQFLQNYHNTNTLSAKVDRSKLLKALQDFQPDLFISMNHTGLFSDLSKALDCPIGIWLLDGPAYLIDKEECKKQAQRYHMFIATRAFRSDLHDAFGIPNNHIHDLPLASDFQATNQESTQNIAFVGTYFTEVKFKDVLKHYGNDRSMISKIRALIDSYNYDRDMLFSSRLKKFELEFLFTGEYDEAYILNLISINKRIKVLDAIEPLGLILYGTQNWTETTSYSLGLSLSFNPSPITTKSDLESIYNSSKINLNISHSQARGGLPWRIFDIMSCNGALVSDYQEDIYALFGKDIGIPIYNNPTEAKEICQKLLNDESHRHFIIESCQRAIQNGHRFKHRLQTMSAALNVDLLSGKAGQLYQLNAQDFYLSYFRQYGSLPVADEKFNLQIFQSSNLAFSSDRSIFSYIDVPPNKQILHEFELTKSAPFLRLDIGEYFSQHSNVKITLSNSPTSNESFNHTIDLSKDILHANDFHYNGQHVTCGFDSYFVFENPFAGKDLRIKFESSIMTRLDND